MLWPFRSRRGAEGGGARRGDVGRAGSASATAGDAMGSADGSAAARPVGRWRELPVLTGVIPAQPTSGSGQFARTLPSRWQQPPVLERLGHDVRSDAPGGTVTGRAMLTSQPAAASGPGAYPAGPPPGTEGHSAPL